MSLSHNFALALAAAIIDATVGYPVWFALLFGSASTWLSGWFDTVEGAEAPGGSLSALAIFLGPVVIGAAVVTQILPSGPFGFIIAALVASAFSGRQTLDARTRAVATAWESEGPYEALVVAEALGPSEAETRLAPACAGAVAARFADEVAAPTLFLAFGGLVGVAVLRAIGVAGRLCRERHDTGPLGQRLADLEAWTLAPGARLGALWLAAAAAAMKRPGAASSAWRPAATPTAPAETIMLTALGPTERDDPAYLRSALALFRRAAALEVAALALLTLFVFALSGLLQQML